MGSYAAVARQEAGVMESRRRPLWIWALACLLGLTALVGIILAVWKLPSLLYGDVSEASADARLQAASGFRTALVAGLAGLAGLGSLAMATRTYRLTQQGQITERYTKATDQLRSDKLETRLGGIYALERIAVDSEPDHRTVVAVLGAFARVHGGQPTSPNNGDAATVERGARDVEAAVTVLGRLPDRFATSRANLASVYVASADLSGANLSGANLSKANLRGAKLRGANLPVADLSVADLRGADLSVANLRGANLSGANLPKANLLGANLWAVALLGAILWGADLSGADLSVANLSGANLSVANLSEAKLRGAKLVGAKLVEAKLVEADLREADLRRADLRRADLRRADLWEAFLKGAMLGEAKCSAATVWPDGFDWKAAGVMLRED
jgi:uncharacterized protein YjbI with pentapeptide repeats